MTKKVNSAEAKSVLSSGRTVLQFSTSWCGGCKLISPAVNKWADEHPEVNVLYIDCDDNGDLVKEYSIKAIPAFVVIQDGVIIHDNLTKLRWTDFDDKFLAK